MELDFKSTQNQTAKEINLNLKKFDFFPEKKTKSITFNIIRRLFKKIVTTYITLRLFNKQATDRSKKLKEKNKENPTLTHL